MQFNYLFYCLIGSVFIIGILMLTSFVMSAGEPFKITERTEYDILTNTQYIEITELLGKDQNINLSQIFDRNDKTSQIEVKEILLNQSYLEPIYEYVNQSIGKYKTINQTEQKNEIGNLTINYYDKFGILMNCDYVLADKSCLQLTYTNTRNETRYNYLPIPSLKKKVEIATKVIEQKSDGIPLPKGSTIQLKVIYSHPLAVSSNQPTEKENKYNISVSSIDGLDKDVLDPTWWNVSWGKYKIVNVSEQSGGTLLRYSVLLNVTYDSDMNVDFSDLRFINSTGDGLLSYWIENKVNSNYADVWVMMPSITASVNNTIYMYYNNTGATTLSNMNGAFILGDDFDDSSINTSKWVLDSYTNNLGGNANIVETGGTITSPAVSNGGGIWSVIATFGNGYEWKSLAKIDAGKYGSYEGIGFYSVAASNPWTGEYGTIQLSMKLEDTTTAMNPFYNNVDVGGFTVVDNTWYTYRGRNYNGAYNLSVSGIGSQSNTGQPTLDSNYRFSIYGEYWSAANSVSMDWVFVRNYTTNEPLTYFGAEQTSSAGDSCSCPSINTNWEVNMSHYCNVTTACDLGTGNLTFTDNGWFSVKNKLETKTGFNLANNQIVYINGTGVILIG